MSSLSPLPVSIRREMLTEEAHTLAARVDTEAKNHYGRTPLHMAVREGHKALARVLVKTGADKDAKDKLGDTPLHMAAMHGHEALGMALVAAGADKDAKNEAGETPLHLAVEKGLKALALALIAGPSLWGRLWATFPLFGQVLGEYVYFALLGATAGMVVGVWVCGWTELMDVMQK